jgi:hypothetical protein
LTTHDPADDPRVYHVLEERTVLDILRELLPDVALTPADEELLKDRLVYEKVDVIESRNADSARRAAAKRSFAAHRHIDGTVTLIPVAARSWHPREVHVRQDLRVTL